MPMHALNALLAEHGLAVPNLGDIDAQTVAGAISTGTHGTGRAHSTLASVVEAVTLVTGTGEILHDRRDHPDCSPPPGSGLGALGVMVEVTLRCVDAFILRADERPLPMGEVLAGLDEQIARHDHVELYWFPYTDRVQLKRNDTVPLDDLPLSRLRGWLDDDFLANTVFAGACRLGRAIPAVVPAISAISARALTARTYTDRSDRVFCTPRRVRFVEMEYEVPREALADVLSALPRIIGALPFKVQFPVEVRFTGPDDVWLSHGYGRDSAYIAVHQYAGSAVRGVLPGVRGRCAPPWAADRTGARCTTGTRSRCARRTRGSTTSWPSGTGSTRPGLRERVPRPRARLNSFHSSILSTHSRSAILAATRRASSPCRPTPPDPSTRIERSAIA